MENLVTVFRGRRVLVTGHTGFKGSWLCEWLVLLGADVTGLSLGVPTQPALFDQLGHAKRLDDRRGDLRDPEAVRAAVRAADPDFVFHLAAQALVRTGYEHPLGTLETNIMGTANLLDILRERTSPCAVVVVTSDKCYRNLETDVAYREEDPLGGRDPYSASKACAEIISAAWRASFFRGHPVRIATARAGNVIGGGDWARDRLLPDAARALSAGRPIPVRNPHAVRPWQHVLEPLSGYLTLAARLSQNVGGLQDAFNFGPPPESHRTAQEVVETLLKFWPGTWKKTGMPGAPHEAAKLHLDISRSREVLGWEPRWDFEMTLRRTAEWYRAFGGAPHTIPDLTRRQIHSYSQ